MIYLKLNLEQLRQDLRHCVVEVVFDKIDDNERRTMRATLMPAIVNDPTFNFQEYIEHQRTKGNIVTVWDVEAAGWRCFYADRVLSCQMMPGYN